ncbi:MAG: MoxR family ATPase [Hyphomonas sp.]|nr:MoxR family ATPase [Hyphomonas sp.]
MTKNSNITTEDQGVPVHGTDPVIFVHSIPRYLEGENLSLEDYKSEHPGTPLYSEKFQKAKAKREEGLKADMTAKVHTMPGGASKQSFSKVFELGNAKAAKNARGQDIMCSVISPPESYESFVPDIDPNYIYNIDDLKAVMMAAELNMTMLLWGMHGTGKTTLVEQFCARTGRAWLRIQHTVSTEESHILGQYVVKDGATVFELGPLAVAMREGLVYMADEYDFALPSVTSVYQSVLEGKPLVIKEAPPELRVIKPHPNFRFFATGNTNGAGDETGLYSGTQIMNAANYSRFGITIEIEYMPEAQEIAVVSGQAKIHKDDSTRLVKVANEIRKGFGRGDISTTISPRELINAARLARVLGTEPDLHKGLELAYCNRLDATDKKAVLDFAQRHFG